MPLQCTDGFSTKFDSYPVMRDYHEQQSKESQWVRCKVNELQIEPLDEPSAMSSRPIPFAAGITSDAVSDTAKNLGLVMDIDGKAYPIRSTAYKSLLDRAKIGGTVLPKLSRKVLSEVLNECLKIYPSDALILIRDQKVSAVHSGDTVDYSVLPIDELLMALQDKLDERFPGNEFENGYTDHALTCASWTMPKQKDDLLGSYNKLLDSKGKAYIAKNLVPGIRFITSDTGVASAKVSALLIGGQYPIHIGSCIAVDHRHQSKVADFTKALDQLFAQFGDSIAKLQKLTEVTLSYPVNAMTRICKKLSMPKKAALGAIQMFEMSYGGGPATAHDVFFALQEIMFLLKTENTPESKLMVIEENLARTLSFDWSEYDLAKAVSY